MQQIRVRGARTHNLKNIEPRAAARPADRDHRLVRLGQVLARLRHAVCGRPAALRRVAVRLRAAVPLDDGQARRRQHRGPLAGDRHRAEGHLAQPALHGRHRHRDLRLPAPAVCARRHPALPRPRHRPHRADGEPDGRPGAEAAGGHRGGAARAAGAAIARASTHELLEDLAGQGFVRVRIDGRIHEMDALPQLDPKKQAHHRGGGGSLRACGPTRRSAWPNRSRRRCGFPAAWRGSPSSMRPSARSWCSPAVTPARCAATACRPLEPKLFSFNSPSGACPTLRRPRACRNSSIRSAW